MWVPGGLFYEIRRRGDFKMVSWLGGMDDTLCDQIVKKIDGKLLSKHKQILQLI